MYSPRGLLLLLTWAVALLYSYGAALVSSWRRRGGAVPALRFAPHGRDAVLVTGASSGLGAATAAALAARGAHVVVTAPSARRAEAAAAAVRAAGGAATPLQLHQRTAAGVAAFAAQLDAAAAAGGWRLRAAVLNAATFAVCPEGHDDDHYGGNTKAPAAAVQLHASLAVNVLGTWRVARAVATRLAPGGRVVLVGSFTHRCTSPAALLAWLRSPGARPQPHPAAAYAASKAAAAAAAAAEHAGGTACVVIADPGLVDTALTRAWPPALAAAARLCGVLTRLMRPPEEAAAVVVAALAVAEDEAKAARPPLYFFGARGARLRPGAAGGGDDDVARAVLAAVRNLDAQAA